MLSKSCQYALRAVLCLAARAPEGLKLSVRDIAGQIEAPEAFTAKILQALVKHRVVSSLKGPYGGFFITSEQLAQPMLSIVHAIDGPGVFRECGLGLQRCSDAHPCPLHHRYKAARDSLRQTFEETSVGQLATDLQRGTAFLTNAL